MSQASQPIVILGCRVNMEPRLSGALGRRVRRAAELYQASGPAEEAAERWVFVSGGKRWAGVTEAEAMRAELTRLGVPGERIVAETRSMSTRQNAAETAALLRSRGVGGITLVTCDFHMPRASRLFRGYGLVVEEAPAPSPRRRGLHQAATVAARGASERLKAWFDAFGCASFPARLSRTDDGRR